MTFWLARDKWGLESNLIFSYSKKPRRIEKGYDLWPNSGCEYAFCYSAFTRITGIKIKKGECRQFRLEEV